MDENKLKGGFIADIISFKIKDSIHLLPFSYVVKYENNESNNLTNMAKQLDLYNREYYFYKEISYYINVKIPKFISILKDEALKDQIYRRICESTILQYKTASSDEVELTTDEGNESD